MVQDEIITYKGGLPHDTTMTYSSLYIQMGGVGVILKDNVGALILEETSR